MTDQLTIPHQPKSIFLRVPETVRDAVRSLGKAWRLSHDIDQNFASKSTELRARILKLSGKS